jgi:hypothetical protein
MHLSGLATFCLTLAAGLPIVLAFSYGFHLLFEAPFLRHRGLSALRMSPLTRVLPRGRKTIAEPGPKPVASEQPAA